VSRGRRRAGKGPSQLVRQRRSGRKFTAEFAFGGGGSPPRVAVLISPAWPPPPPSFLASSTPKSESGRGISRRDDNVDKSTVRFLPSEKIGDYSLALKALKSEASMTKRDFSRSFRKSESSRRPARIDERRTVDIGSERARSGPDIASVVERRRGLIVTASRRYRFA